MVIAGIEKCREVIDRYRAHGLTLQNRVAAQDTRIADALALIAQTRENALDPSFYAGQPSDLESRRAIAQCTGAPGLKQQFGFDAMASV